MKTPLAKVYITGGCGFIGSHLADHLISKGVERLTIVDNFFLGAPSNLSEAYRRMPDMRVLRLDASVNSEVREAFSAEGNDLLYRKL